MLMQLVCVDRRYQRMNCFNVRELQGNLKRKFFTDLVNSNDHRDFLNQSILGMRFKTNNNLAITPDMEAFYNFGTTSSSKVKTFEFVNTYTSNMSINFSNSFSLFHINLFNISTNVINYVKSITDVILSISLYSTMTTFNIPTSLANLMSFNLTSFKFYTTSSSNFKENFNNVKSENETTVFNSENMTMINSNSNISSSLSETSNSYRFNRFSNPLISYDYKCGHYLGI